MSENKKSDKKKEPKVEIQKIDLDTFVSMKNISWTMRTRLKYLIENNELPSENSLDGWGKIIKKI